MKKFIKQRSKLSLRNFSTMPLLALASLNGGSSAAVQTGLHSNLMPWFITGFSDAEGCFYIRVTKKDRMKIGWAVELIFSIRLHIKDLPALESIREHFSGAGKIYIHEKEREATFRVSSVKELNIIVNHFDKYPLITHK